MGKYQGIPAPEIRAEKHSKTAAGRIPGINRTDYTFYQMNKKEWMQCGAIYVLLDLCISYLFFRSWIPFVIFLAGFPLYIKEQKKTYLKRRANDMLRQFLDGIQMVSASLQAGYSVENAFRAAYQEILKVNDQNSFIAREFQLIKVQLDMNRNIEELLMDLGKRSGVEDILSFAEVFLTAKRSGGDLLLIIRNTASCIRQKQETMQEIETCLSGKVMEQNIMSLVPILILAYINLASSEFLEAMYGNAVGISVMIICFLIYGAAYVWGKNIIRIEV